MKLQENSRYAWILWPVPRQPPRRQVLTFVLEEKILLNFVNLSKIFCPRL